jgi:hypothetical protein
MPQVEHKPENTIHVSKVAKLWLRILKVHVGHHEIGVMKMFKKCLKRSMRTGDVQLTIFVPF